MTRGYCCSFSLVFLKKQTCTHVWHDSVYNLSSPHLLTSSTSPSPTSPPTMKSPAPTPRRRRPFPIRPFLLLITFLTVTTLSILTLRQIELSPDTSSFPLKLNDTASVIEMFGNRNGGEGMGRGAGRGGTCATVEEMGKGGVGEEWWRESLRVRRMIRIHFEINGPARVRTLPPSQFCRHGFVLGKASEAGFGNEMYKILTASALSVMLNRSLIIGQSRGKYPFEDYIAYTNQSFTLKEVKHLWRQHGCASKFHRDLVVRIDDFQKPSDTNALCSNWREWKHPVIWFQNTTDAVAAQFFLKNVHPDMRKAASELFGKPELLHSRPNVFGELINILISPSESIEEAVDSVLPNADDPDISLHMRMLMNRSVRSAQAALSCIKKALQNLHGLPRPKVVLISDTPSSVDLMSSSLKEFAEVLHFDYKLFRGNISGKIQEKQVLGFRIKDWGPTPRWVAFVDFFLASRAKHVVMSGAHRRVGTTYAQLIAALAAARNLDENSTSASTFSFFSSFSSNSLRHGLSNQMGWGHVWNRFAGPLSCRGQHDQCAFTPLLPPAWWDGIWQSPIPRDIRRLEAYGMKLSALGTVDEDQLQSFCQSRKEKVIKVPITAM
ncbi:hypothetical protein Droror1_Dr00021755 [Drosera rotundifolia]